MVPQVIDGLHILQLKVNTDIVRSIKGCFLEEWVFYLEESGKRIDVRCKRDDGRVYIKTGKTHYSVCRSLSR